MGNIASNIKYLRKKNELTQQQLADILKVKRPVIGAYEEARAEPKSELLKQMANFFSSTTDELIDESLSDAYFAKKAKKEEAEKQRQNEKLRILSITVDQNDRENIELVPAKASAGYLNGFSDPDYVAELPKFHLPMLKGGTFRAFELKGDSMLPLQPGTIVVAQYEEDWKNLKADDTYVLLTKNDGIVYKRIQHKSKAKKALKLISDNPTYEPYTVSMEDVLEIWKAKAYISTVFPERTGEPSLEKLTEMVQQLHQAVNKK